MISDIQRIAAFSDQGKGGNPAGVWIGEEFPTDGHMLAVAKKVGYSETAFAIAQGPAWRVRYFAPDTEVPFCGHATIALGAALRERTGLGVYDLILGNDQISLDVRQDRIALRSPKTHNVPLSTAELVPILSLFGLGTDDLDPRVPPAWISAGAKHALLALNHRETLSEMQYDFKQGAAFMRENGLITIALAYAQSDQLFYVRNAFAIGGVLEDPATGAAAAALSGYLRDIAWPHGGAITILQGQDMGMPSRIEVLISKDLGASVTVMGETRLLV